MEIRYYPPETLTSEQIRLGLKFILRRFFEEWSVNRTIDISANQIKKRVNVLLYDRESLIGWLGIESDGEIVNCCIEKNFKGVYYLQLLIKEAYKSFPQDRFYAHVPMKQLGSACAFIKTGMKLDKPPKIEIKKYKGKLIKLVRLNYEHAGKDFDIENEFLKEILKRIKSIEKHENTKLVMTKLKYYIKSNYKSFILWLVVAIVIYFIFITKVQKISRKEYLRFVMNNASYKEDQEIFKEHFGFLSDKIENYEKLSYEQHINLINKILTLFDKTSDKEAFSQILNIINRNHDIIRIVRNIRRFHSELINNGIHNKKTLNILNTLCEAYRLVLSDTGDLLMSNIKKNLEMAEKQFKIVFNDAKKLPNKLRDDIKLESLRYLTYCSLRLGEENSGIGDWLQAAEKLKEKIQDPAETSLRYQQKYFWISLANFIITIKKEDDNIYSEYHKYLSSFSKKDPNCVYLKAKLLQHSKLIPLGKREIIYHFISAK